VIVVSPDGGVDIEEVAEKTPDRILKMPVDIHTGISIFLMLTKLSTLVLMQVVLDCYKKRTLTGTNPYFLSIVDTGTI
jgi:succinyl-CoA synthetase beta subunit